MASMRVNALLSSSNRCSASPRRRARRRNEIRWTHSQIFYAEGVTFPQEVNDFSALHYEDDMLHCADICEGITGDSDDVSEFTRLESPQILRLDSAVPLH